MFVYLLLAEVNSYKLKLLKEEKHEVKDCGIYEETPIKDYEVAEKVGLSVSNGEVQRGILICGNGIGEHKC